MEAVTVHAPERGVRAVCRALVVPRATYYRTLRPWHGPRRRGSSLRALTTVERRVVLEALLEPRFCEQAPAEVYATLLDEGRYLCAARTMYRILAENKEIRDRRDQLHHPSYARPELLATAPNQLWSWDITKLKGPEKWNHYHLYVVLDVYSRYVVGWMVADRESATLATKLIAEICKREHIEPGQLALRADRGSSMRSKCLALMFADLGVTKTHSRPHVSDDNSYSESHSKRLSIARISPRASARSKMRAHSATTSSTGTISSIITLRWHCSRRTMSITAPRRSDSRVALPSSLSPLRSIRRASSPALRTPALCRLPHGSTNRARQPRQPSRLCKFINTWSQNRCQAPVFGFSTSRIPASLPAPRTSAPPSRWNQLQA